MPSTTKFQRIKNDFEANGTISPEQFAYLIRRIETTDIQVKALMKKDKKHFFELEKKNSAIRKRDSIIYSYRTSLMTHYDSVALMDITRKMNEVLAWYRKPSKYWLDIDGNIPVMMDNGQQAKEVTAELMAWIKSPANITHTKAYKKVILTENQRLQLKEDEQVDKQATQMYDFAE